MSTGDYFRFLLTLIICSISFKTCNRRGFCRERTVLIKAVPTYLELIFFCILLLLYHSSHIISFLGRKRGDEKESLRSFNPVIHWLREEITAGEKAICTFIRDILSLLHLVMGCFHLHCLETFFSFPVLKFSKLYMLIHPSINMVYYPKYELFVTGAYPICI